MKKVLVFLVFFLIFTSKQIFASVRCETQYGGGQTCTQTGELLLDKKVWNSNSWVDNLFLSDHKFVAGEEVVFKIDVKNTGDEKFSKVTVKDTLPNYLKLISGSLSYDISDLDPGETDSGEVHAKVVSDLPFDKTTLCLVNTAEAWGNDQYDRDTAQVCLENKVLGVTSLPPTGPNGWIFILLGSLILGITGIYLAKRKNNFWEGVKN